MSDSEEEVEFELEEFTLGEHTLTITTIAFLPITVLMNNREREKEISGQKLWCGSLCLVNYLFQHPQTVRGAAVVELGAGTGVVSMIAHRLRAASVAATDHDPLSLAHMREDFPRNSCAVETVRLDWLQPDLAELQHKLHFANSTNSTDNDNNNNNNNTVNSTVSDADNTHAAPPRLVLLAGDVLYKSLLLEPFFRTVCLLLALCEDSELVLCHIPRAGNGHELVQEKAREKGLRVEAVPRERWAAGQVFEHCPQEDLDRAQIYRIRK